MAQSHLRAAWWAAKDRCNNRHNHDYRLYGGAGIKFHDPWLNFEEFTNWAMENGYKAGLCLLRRYKNNNYCPDNCYWGTKQELAKTQPGRRPDHGEARGKKKPSTLYMKFGMVRNKGCTWKTYQEFKKWALKTGYKPGCRLYRRDANNNFGPENCYWKKPTGGEE